MLSIVLIADFPHGLHCLPLQQRISRQLNKIDRQIKKSQGIRKCPQLVGGRGRGDQVNYAMALLVYRGVFKSRGIKEHGLLLECVYIYIFGIYIHHAY
jgi:hypothetical protein